MKYQVTALRKRPKTFDEITGQPFVIQTLSNSITSGQIAHAYLFSGPRGVGKTSIARLFATAVNAPGKPSIDNWDYEGSKAIAAGKSLDVIEIDGASHTGVNDVRTIIDEILFAPTSLSYKIYIIDEVHMLSISAFNALLKTIEEPPDYVIFIFATTELHKVPATIRSRCQQYSFQRISTTQIQKNLEDVCKELQVPTEEEALRWIAREATGSLRDAYTLLDQCLAFAEGHLTLEKLGKTLGLPDLRLIISLLKAIIHGEVKEAFEKLDTILAQGVAIQYCIQELVYHMRTILFITVGAIEDTKESLYAELDGLNEVQLTHGLELLFACYRDIRYSINQRYELETLVRKLCGLRDYIRIEELVQRVEKLRPSTQTIQTSPKQTQATQATNTTESRSVGKAADDKTDNTKDNSATVQNTPTPQKKKTTHTAETIREHILSIIAKTKHGVVEQAVKHGSTWKLSDDGTTVSVEAHNNYVYGVFEDHWSSIQTDILSQGVQTVILQAPNVQSTKTQREPTQTEKTVENVFHDIIEHKE